MLGYRCKKMKETNKFHITKKYALKFVVPDDEIPLYLVYKQTQIDAILDSSGVLLRWYIVGGNGYYVIKRVSGEMILYKSLDVVPKKYRRKFEKMKSN